MTRKQMEERVDDIAEFTELGDFLRMPLRTYSTGMRVRLALGVVTSIDPEILLLDEGIGAVDASFLAKSKKRLVDLVDRAGLLVFASHSDELLRDLCDTAIWMEQGRVRMQGDLEEVLRRLQGHRRVTAEPVVAPPRRRTPTVVAVVVTRHRPASCSRRAWPRSPRRPGRSTTSSSSTTATDQRPPRRSSGRRGCRSPTCPAGATSAARAASPWACCTPSRSGPTGCGAPTTTAGPRTTPVLATLLDAGASGTGWPRCRRW